MEATAESSVLSQDSQTTAATTAIANRSDTYLLIFKYLFNKKIIYGERPMNAFEYL